MSNLDCIRILWVNNKEEMEGLRLTDTLYKVYIALDKQGDAIEASKLATILGMTMQSVNSSLVMLYDKGYIGRKRIKVSKTKEVYVYYTGILSKLGA